MNDTSDFSFWLICFQQANKSSLQSYLVWAKNRVDARQIAVDYSGDETPVLDQPVRLQHAALLVRNGVFVVSHPNRPYSPVAL